MRESPGERAVKLAARMLELGIAGEMVSELLRYPPDLIEAQLDWLPHRKARRPGAFLINAIRRNYSPPKQFFYANHSAVQNRGTNSLDQDSKHRP